MQEGNSDNEIDERLNRHERGSNQIDSDSLSYLNTNISENSGLTVETSRSTSSEISSQMSRKLEEMKSDLITRILDANNTEIENWVLPSVKNAVRGQTSASQVRPQRDLRSNGLHSEIASQVAQDAHKDFPRLLTMSSNQINNHRENSVDSNQSDDEGAYDMLGLLSEQIQKTAVNWARR